MMTPDEFYGSPFAVAITGRDIKMYSPGGYFTRTADPSNRWATDAGKSWTADQMGEIVEQLRIHRTIWNVAIDFEFLGYEVWVGLMIALLDLPMRQFSASGLRKRRPPPGECAQIAEEIAVLVSTHKHLREFRCNLNVECVSVIVAGVARSRLRLVTLHEKYLDSDSFVKLIEENRSIRVLTVKRGASVVDYRMFTATSMNWALQSIVPHNTVHGELAQYYHNFNAWYAVHEELRKKVITLLPLRLPAYIMLWILDSIGLMSRRYKWQGDPAYDPFHGRKIALIERLIRSYRRLH
jgi:hypothetical protein